MASVSIGRSRLPPEEIRWLATSGIMVTSEPVRDRMVVLTRSISAATRETSASIEAFDGLSKGTITATPVSTFAQFALSLSYNRKCRNRRQGQEAVDMPPAAPVPGRRRRCALAGIGSDQRYCAGFRSWSAARRRQHPPSGAGPEHEHHRGFTRRAAAADSGA